MLNTVHVLIGSGVEVDVPSVQRLVSEAARELGLDAQVILAGDDAEMAELVDATRTDAFVICRGTASEAIAAQLTIRQLPTVTVDITRGTAPPGAAFRTACLGEIRGRGVSGFRWALRLLVEHAAWPLETIHYGGTPENVGDLRLPSGQPPFPVAVLLHGGGWAEWWTRDLMGGLAVDLARRGFASWNVEYRRVGSSGGGWPQTFSDAASAIDHLAKLATRHPLDLSRVVVIGHSAGGQLALWSAARSAVATDERLGLPCVTPAMVVSLAGVTDLVEADRRGLGGEDVVAPLLGGRHDEVPGRYAEVSPLALLPIGVPQLVVQGLADGLVDLVEMNARYVDAARSSGDDVSALALPGVDHHGVIDPATAHWNEIVERVRRRLRTPVANPP